MAQLCGTIDSAIKASVNVKRADFLMMTKNAHEAALPARVGRIPKGPFNDDVLAARQAKTCELRKQKLDGVQLIQQLHSFALAVSEQLNDMSNRPLMAVYQVAERMLEEPGMSVGAKLASRFMELVTAAVGIVPGMMQSNDPTQIELNGALSKINVIRVMKHAAVWLPHAVWLEIDYGLPSSNIYSVLGIDESEVVSPALENSFVSVVTIRDKRRQETFVMLVSLFRIKHLLGMRKSQQVRAKWHVVMQRILPHSEDERADFNRWMNTMQNSFTSLDRIEAMLKLALEASAVNWMTRLTLIHTKTDGLNEMLYPNHLEKADADQAEKEAAIAKLSQRWREILTSDRSVTEKQWTARLDTEITAHRSEEAKKAAAASVAQQAIPAAASSSSSAPTATGRSKRPRAAPGSYAITTTTAFTSPQRSSKKANLGFFESRWMLPGDVMIALLYEPQFRSHRALIITPTTTIATALASAHVVVGAPLPENPIFAITQLLSAMPVDDGGGAVVVVANTFKTVTYLEQKKKRAAMIRLDVISMHGSLAVVSYAL